MHKRIDFLKCFYISLCALKCICNSSKYFKLILLSSEECILYTYVIRAYLKSMFRENYTHARTRMYLQNLYYMRR